jgi:hypothetical protein
MERNCYCDLWTKSPEVLRKQGIPEGYCGICERCGRPGHLRHFPGPVPYTGAWCDRCYKMIGWMWLARTPLFWLGLVLLGWLGYRVVRALAQ